MASEQTKEQKRKRLRELMRRHKLNSVRVAKLVDCRPQTVREWMCGRWEIQPVTMKLLESLLARE